MTLIAVYTSDGCVGRCDARCYNAKSEHCDCICKGTNHGKGLKQAMDNTREMYEPWITDFVAAQQLETFESTVPCLQQSFL